MPGGRIIYEVGDVRAPAAVDCGLLRRQGSEAGATAQQLGALGLLVAQDADQLAVEDE